MKLAQDLNPVHRGILRSPTALTLRLSLRTKDESRIGLRLLPSLYRGIRRAGLKPYFAEATKGSTTPHIPCF